MVFRFLMRYFANNEQLVQQLSESGPVRAAARFVVGLFNRSKNMIEEHELDKKLSPEKVKEIAKKFTENIKEEVNEAKENIKRGRK